MIAQKQKHDKHDKITWISVEHLALATPLPPVPIKPLASAETA